MLRPRPRLTSLWVACALILGCAQSSGLSDEEREALVGTLRDVGMPPVDYVVSKFSDHDVVVLGEHQLVLQDVEFVVALIPALHEAGVNVLAIEYATAEDQLAIDSLVTDLQYDAPRAVAIQKKYSGGIWPYREYLEIYKTAWDLNRTRDPDTEPFRVVGISPNVDFEAIHFGEDDEARLARRILAGTEPYMAAATRRLSTELGEKALVYCAMRRAFTDYVPPAVGEDGAVRVTKRLGNLLADSLGDRVVTIALHAPWPGIDPANLVNPCGGKLDLAIAAYGDSVGFDVAGTPFADLVEKRSAYVAGKENGVALGMLVDGYVAHVPISELTGVSVITSWIPGEQALVRAKRRFPDQEQAASFTDVRDVLNAFQRDAALPRRFSRAR